MCINFLNNSPEGLTASEISTLAKEDRAGISRALAELLDNGFVKYIDDESTDKRKYRAKVTLTDKGLDYAKKVSTYIVNAVMFGGSDISDEDRNIFYSVLTTISENLEQYYHELERNTDHE